jgi:ERCC4-type nuclease
MINHDDFTIIVDTREQQPWSFEDYVVANKKLDTGDYSIEGLQHFFTIERKKSINEIANNIIEPRFKDVIMRMSQLKYSFFLLEFNITDVLNYPVGSNLPKKMWDKIKISPAFIMKHILDWQVKHNIKVLFCGNASNAEQTAEYIFKKMYLLYEQEKQKESPDET